MTIVPEDEPKNEPGDGLFQETVMINATMCYDVPRAVIVPFITY